MVSIDFFLWQQNSNVFPEEIYVSCFACYSSLGGMNVLLPNLLWSHSHVITTSVVCMNATILEFLPGINRLLLHLEASLQGTHSKPIPNLKVPCTKEM